MACKEMGGTAELFRLSERMRGDTFTVGMAPKAPPGRRVERVARPLDVSRYRV